MEVGMKFKEALKAIQEETGIKFKKVMHEWKLGQLKDSHGNKVTDQKQALAIAFSEQDKAKKKGKKKAK